jgi:hypothetical protein
MCTAEKLTQRIDFRFKPTNTMVCKQTEIDENMTAAEHIRAVFYRMVSTVYHSVNAAYTL